MKKQKLINEMENIINEEKAKITIKSLNHAFKQYEHANITAKELLELVNSINEFNKIEYL